MNVTRVRQHSTYFCFLIITLTVTSVNISIYCWPEVSFSRGPPSSFCSMYPTSTAGLEATSRKTYPHLAPCNWGRPWPSELWNRDCLEKGHYSQRMATYCRHSNARAEYALKEEEEILLSINLIFIAIFEHPACKRICLIYYFYAFTSCASRDSLGA